MIVARWTRAQVEQFAPDDKSVKAAQKLARPGPWSETGSTDTLVWGKCQGSGKTPYQVSVDLTGPAAKCTCPSRKFPCKHGVALLMLWVAGDGSIADAAEAAEFANEWAQGRSDRAAQTEARKQAKADTPVDPEAQAKRLEKRLALMDAGAADFETWLGDLYRKGFASARQQPYSFWEEPAARLLDAQLPGLAQRVRGIPGSLYGDDWADVLLEETGRLFTAVKAWHRRDQLSDNDMGNLRAFIGWATPTDDVRAREATTDTWLVQGLHRTDDGRLKAQRTWLCGTTSGERALVLDFAANAASLTTSHMVGSLITSPLAYYPGSGVRRALFVNDPTTTTSAAELPEPATIGVASVEIAEQIAVNPFLDQHPVCIHAHVITEDSVTVVVDAEGNSWPLTADIDPWPLLARCGTEALPIFGEFGSGRFRPLTIQVDSQLVPV